MFLVMINRIIDQSPEMETGAEIFMCRYRNVCTPLYILSSDKRVLYVAVQLCKYVDMDNGY